jgi:hypothetical protein
MAPARACVQVAVTSWRTARFRLGSAQVLALPDRSASVHSWRGDNSVGLDEKGDAQMNIPGFTAANSLIGANNHRSRISTRKRALEIEPQLRVGGGGLSNKCDDDYGECYIDCSVKYPESKDSPGNLNSMYRDACFDSCDAAHDLCGGGRLSISRGNGFRSTSRRFVAR